MAVNLTVLATIDMLLFRPVAGFDARDVFAVYSTSQDDGPGVSSYANFVDLRTQSRTFERLAAWKSLPASVTRGDDSFGVRAMLATAGYFETLGLQPQRGRFFTAAEDRVPNDAAVAVLSDAFWRSRFGARDVVGDDLLLNNRPFRIIGITPQRFRGTSATDVAEVFVPMMMQPHLMPSSGYLLERRGWSGISIVGKLRRGAAPASAGAELSTLAARIEAAHPSSDRGLGFVTAPIAEASLPPAMRATAKRVSLILVMVAACTLLLVCANVTNLLLVRTIHRARDLAVRLALGAGRWTLIREFAVESSVLAFAGALFGLALTATLLRVLRASTPLLEGVTITSGTLLVAPLLALLVAALCAAAPLVVMSRSDLQKTLRGMAGMTSRGTQRSTSAMVIVQVALSVILLVSTGVFVRSLFHLRQVVVGYDEQLVVTTLAFRSEEAPAAVVAYYDNVLARVRAMPGVEAAAIANSIPLSGDYDSLRATIDGTDRKFTAGFQIAGAGFFHTLGVPIRRGRDFAASDRGGSPVCIVNESFARKLAPDGNPIGLRLQYAEDKPAVEIVGVVADSRFRELREASDPTMYFAHAQVPDNELARNMSIFIRASAPAAVMRDLRPVLRSIDARVPVAEIGTLATMRDQASAKEKNLSVVLGAVSLLALGLATLGLYGVLSLSVVQRTRELGIRMALGATSGSIMRLTLGGGARLAAIGTLAAVAAQWALRRVLSPMLFETRVSDPLVWAAVFVCLAVTVAVAGFLPARRASRIDPVEALKYQ